MNRNVWLLFCCQALMNAVMSGQVVMSALVGHSLAVDKAVTTLPMAIQMAATMAASIPAGMVFSRLGRRPGFWLGCVGSIGGSLVFALGVWRGSFLLYCLGALPAGLGFGISQHLRFAASEVAAPAARPRAIALVMTGGLVAAVLGPEIVKRTNALVLPTIFVGTYLCMLALPMIAAILLAVATLPPPPPRHVVPVRVRAILRRPTFLVAVVAGVVGYGSMNLVMASTPLEMVLCGYGVNASADVIRWHSISMFLPGFVTGRLIQRFGAHAVIVAGGLITLGCVTVNFIYAPVFGTFLVALMLLGLGWNFMFVGATALLTSAHDAQERVRVQATNDFIVFGSVAITAFGSGAIEATAGWHALNLTVVPGVLIALSLVLWHWQGRRVAAPAIAE
jgi:MFS family permease